ncbi:unnamed protein product [Mycena citricolor]|uniref:Ribosomal RNA-processing protein 17 n=1 Tax=Mycena citricolor TaxID=2018698 RepID=A0AAD2HUY9_9AGAR|nr:unnamed protein product [Mycena citricolor]
MNHNLATLTRSHAAIAAKKKAKNEQIKEILFDDDARREFLTGFHKRKVQKADAARKKATERAKQERLETRREQRRELRQRAIDNAAEVEKAYAGDQEEDEDDDQWAGISENLVDKGKGKLMEEEYEGEDTLATVTVVEDFDPDTIIHGPRTDAEPVAVPPEYPRSKPEKAPNRTNPTPKLKPKIKSQKIRYETKDARKRERTKQRARRTEKAERAGGKASKKSNGGRQISASLAAMHRTVDDYDSMAKREMIKAKQEKAQMRVQKFRTDYHELRTQFEQIKAQSAAEASCSRSSG